MKTLIFSTLFGLAGLVLASSEPASAAGPGEDIRSLQTEIQALKEGQQAIRNDIKEIKDILQAARRPPEPVEDVNLTLNVGQDPYKGQNNARLTLVEFSDYQCPFCSRHVNSVLPQLEKDYVGTNKVKYVIRDYPLPFHQQAAKAAEAAHCAGEQGKYWEMHNQLFNNQKDLQVDQLPKYAQTIGLNLPAFQQCLDSGKFAEKAQKSIAEGNQAGVKGTPTFLLGFTESDGATVKAVKIIRGANPYPVFKKAIDDLLAAKEGEKSVEKQ